MSQDLVVKFKKFKKGMTLQKGFMLILVFIFLISLTSSWLFFGTDKDSCENGGVWTSVKNDSALYFCKNNYFDDELMEYRTCESLDEEKNTCYFIDLDQIFENIESDENEIETYKTITEQNDKVVIDGTISDKFSPYIFGETKMSAFENSFDLEYKDGRFYFDTFDGLSCNFLWDSPTSLDLSTTKIDFRQGEFFDIKCNEKYTQVGDVLYFNSGWIIDIDPSIIHNDTANFTGTFNKTYYNSSALILNSSNWFGDGSDGNTTISSSTNFTVPNKSGAYDGEMVVKNYENLVINSGVYVSTDQPGRGLLIYVKGNLTVNGTISMTGRGAFINPTTAGVTSNGLRIRRAKSGETDTNTDANLLNGTGYVAVTAENNQPVISGNGKVWTIYRDGALGGSIGGGFGLGFSGANGTTGQSGGGGGGGRDVSDEGTGANGTCFSGGSGGGGGMNDETASSNATAYGGAGGEGDTGSGGRVGGGGAGNPGGYGIASGQNGTGGLLIIIVGGDISGTGKISANGLRGGSTSDGGGGGGSGGGNILLLYGRSNSSFTGSIEASGGIGGTGESGRHGGNGGNGSVQISNIDPFNSFVSSGEYISQIIDAGTNYTWQNISWENTTPSGGFLDFYAMSCDDAACSGESWTNITDSSPQNLSLNDSQYFRYKTILFTNDTTQTVQLYNVTINYRLSDNVPTFDDSLLVPVTAYTNDTLNGSIKCIDVENASVNLTIRAYNGTVLYNITSLIGNDTLGSLSVYNTSTYKGETWNFTASCDDGVQTAYVDIGQRTIANSPLSWVVEPSNQTIYTGNETNYTYSCSDPDLEDTITYANNVTGTATSEYSLFNTSDGTFQFRFSFFEYTNSPFAINASCSDGSSALSKDFWVNATLPSGGSGSPESCDLGCIILSSGCAAIMQDECTLIS